MWLKTVFLLTLSAIVLSWLPAQPFLPTLPKSDTADRHLQRVIYWLCTSTSYNFTSKILNYPFKKKWMSHLRFHHLHRYVWLETQLERQSVNRETKKVRGFRFNEVWRRFKDALVETNTQGLLSFFSPSTHLWHLFCCICRPEQTQLETGGHKPRHSLWRGSVCICPLAPLLAAAAGQSLLASAGNSPEPYTRYLNTNTQGHTLKEL